MNKKKIGIFGGSFNPIHIGHLGLANYLCEFTELEEIWFMVSPHNPLKQQSDLWPDDLRLKLVQAAIQEYNKFKACDFEFNLPRPSYMFNTLKELEKSYPCFQFVLIIGADNWLCFHEWYNYKQILLDYEVYIYPRPGHNISREKLPPTVKYIDCPTFNISSTAIRESLKEGKDLQFFMHSETYKLLKKNNVTP